MADGQAAIRGVSIFGSCVGRDTAEKLRERGWRMGAYVARQSLISHGLPAPDGALDLSAIRSAFVRRVLTEDLAGTRRQRLGAAADITDVLLWDIIDERLGVLDLGDGAVITRSTEGLTAHLYDSLEGARLVEFGSDEHFERWRAALPAWRAELDELGLLGRTVLLEVPWAMVDESGLASPSSWGMHALEANWFSVRYYEAVREVVEPRVLTLPEELAVASAGNRWGLAPFHYAESAYDWFADEIERLVAAL